MKNATTVIQTFNKIRSELGKAKLKVAVIDWNIYKINFCINGYPHLIISISEDPNSVINDTIVIRNLGIEICRGDRFSEDCESKLAEDLMVYLINYA
jgi:hypothetical protein